MSGLANNELEQLAAMNTPPIAKHVVVAALDCDLQAQPLAAHCN